MCLHGLIPLVQAVARDAELTRQLRSRFAARSHLTHRFELELRRELLTLDHGTPPGPLSPLSGVRISRATPGSLLSTNRPVDRDRRELRPSTTWPVSTCPFPARRHLARNPMPRRCACPSPRGLNGRTTTSPLSTAPR